MVAVGAGALLAQRAGLLPGSATPTPATAGREDTPPTLVLTPPDEGDIPAIEEAAPLTGRLVTAKAGRIVTAKVTTAGGSIKAGGMTIEFPADALREPAVVSVTPATITGLGAKTDFGGAVLPATPLYAVELGGAELLQPVTVTLTLDTKGVPEGAVPMAFSYDPEAGMLTPLSPISADGTTLVSLATHFSPVMGAFVLPGMLPDFADSGFRPGIDDWQTGNWGSYVAPGGQCEGITTSEIWYYVYQRKAAGATPLFGLYDNNGAEARTPALWVDDSDAYRLTGSVQAGPLADRAAYLNQRNAGWSAADGRMTYTAFKAAIALTGQPQMIRITDNPANGGHTMTVYGVSPNWLLIADPNYPGVGRRIRFDPDTGKLGPFASGTNAAAIAAGKGVSYVHFAYVHWQLSKSAEWLKGPWAAFQAGTAGDGVYPGYALDYQAGVDAAGKPVWAPLGPGIAVSVQPLRVRLRPATQGNDVRLTVYPGTATVFSQSVEDTSNSGGAIVDVPLAPGANPFGFHIEQSKDADTKWRYVDFVRTVVTLGDQPTPSGGRWVLAEVIPEGPDEAPFSNSDEQLAVTASNGSVSVSYNYDGPPHRNERATLTWGPPPTSAAAGEVWQTTLSATGACAGDLDFAWAASVSVAIAWTSGGEPKYESFAATANCEKPSGTAALAWTFPAYGGPADGELRISAGGGESHSSASFVYRYTWQP